MRAQTPTLDLSSIPLDVQLALAGWCLERGLATAKELIQHDDRIEREFAQETVDVWCTLSRAFSAAATARRG